MIFIPFILSALCLCWVSQELVHRGGNTESWVVRLAVLGGIGAIIGLPMYIPAALHLSAVGVLLHYLGKPSKLKS